MTRDEVMAMTDKELRATAWELIGGCWGEDAPDYPNDIAAAWPLLGKLYGRRGIACIETYMTDGECQVTLWTAMQNTVVLRQWKEGDRPEQAITRAFIIAMEENHG